MVANQWQIEGHCAYLTTYQEQQIEEDVYNVLG